MSIFSAADIIIDSYNFNSANLFWVDTFDSRMFR